jgi:hypothetical protein
MPTRPFFEPGVAAGKGHTMVADASDYTRFLRIAAVTATTAVAQGTPNPTFKHGITDRKTSTIPAEVRFFSHIYGQFNSVAKNRG